MVEATDELRERLAAATDHEPMWDTARTGEPMGCSCGQLIAEPTWEATYRHRADAILSAVAAVVAEARTEAVETAERIAATFRENEDRFREMGHTSIGIEYSRKALGAEEVVAVLRGVGNQKVGVTVDDLALDEMDGNQNAEPRWSANRLEEVLREGLPDQNAEPEWEWGYGHESESGLVPVLGFEGRYSEGRSREIAEKQMNDDLRWRYPLALMKRRKAGPWLPADQKGTEQ